MESAAKDSATGEDVETVAFVEDDEDVAVTGNVVIIDDVVVVIIDDVVVVVVIGNVELAFTSNIAELVSLAVVDLDAAVIGSELEVV